MVQIQVEETLHCGLKGLAHLHTTLVLHFGHEFAIVHAIIIKALGVSVDALLKAHVLCTLRAVFVLLYVVDHRIELRIVQVLAFGDAVDDAYGFLFR